MSIYMCFFFVSLSWLRCLLVWLSYRFYDTYAKFGFWAVGFGRCFGLVPDILSNISSYIFISLYLHIRIYIYINYWLSLAVIRSISYQNDCSPPHTISWYL